MDVWRWLGRRFLRSTAGFVLGAICQHKSWRSDVYGRFMVKSLSGELMIVLVLIAGDYFLLGIVVIHPHRQVRMDPDD